MGTWNSISSFAAAAAAAKFSLHQPDKGIRVARMQVNFMTNAREWHFFDPSIDPSIHPRTTVTYHQKRSI
jgi:hypothetical protein